jgi:hypothetical protein
MVKFHMHGTSKIDNMVSLIHGQLVILIKVSLEKFEIAFVVKSVKSHMPYDYVWQFFIISN